jgi:hypothetical protein
VVSEMKKLLEDVEVCLLEILLFRKEILKREKEILIEANKGNEEYIEEIILKRKDEMIIPLELLIKDLDKLVDDLAYADKMIIFENEFSVVLVVR